MSRMGDIPLSYQETRGKRGVTVPYDDCRRQIKEQNERSHSPEDREASPDHYMDGYLGYQSMSARNPTTLPDSRSTPYLQVAGMAPSSSGAGLMAHLNSNRESVKVESEFHLNRPSTTKNKRISIPATTKKQARKTKIAQ